MQAPGEPEAATQRSRYRGVLVRARELWRFREIRLLLFALVPVTGIWSFVEIADEVVEGEIDKYDRAVLRAMRAPDNPADPWGPAWFEEAMRDVTALGSIAVLALATAITAGYLLLRRSRGALLLLLGSTLGGLALSAGLKVAFGRPRPDLVPHLTTVVSASFPSGHSSMSAVVYLTLAALLARLVAESRLKVYCIAVALLITTLVGLSRIYVGVHYPSDVVAGWALGLSWASLAWIVAWVLERRGRI